MNALRLNLKGIYFDAIKSGEKQLEYRLRSKWEKRLDGKMFSHIELFRGYPKRGDDSRCLKRKWLGFRFETITHPHFGDKPVEVIAIDVTTPL